jgi:hypothetical protein
MNGKFHKYPLICAHAPTEAKEYYEKDCFYDNLEKAYDVCPKFDIKMYLGDFNAKVGKGEFAKPNIGQNSLHADSRDNGEPLITFAVFQKNGYRRNNIPT